MVIWILKVLCDTFVCQMLYYRREDVPYLVMAEELGVGSADLEHANLIQIRFEKGTKEEEQGSEETASGKDINRKAKEVKDIHKTVWKGWEDVDIPRERKIVELQDAVEEVESCSACYGYLIPALDMLKQEGLFEKLDCKIAVGQGYRGKSGKLGVGNCTCRFEHFVKGCPPTEIEIYEYLKKYLIQY